MPGKAIAKQDTATGGELPPVAVSCTSGECGYQFLSRAERLTVVRCPKCRHAVRVKRPRPAGWQRKPRSSPPGCAHPDRQAYEETPRPAVASAGPVMASSPLPVTTGGQGDADDGRAYIRDHAGRYVLADLAAGGRMIPVHLIDERFRVLTPGLCSVYGCQGPARRMIRGWPVCIRCHRELEDTPDDNQLTQIRA